MTDAGVTDETVLTLDYNHFGTVEDDIRRLAEQLSENYSIEVLPSDDGKTWLASGTTRPYGVDGMVGERLRKWSEYMCDVANSYGCVFSTWKLVDAKHEKEWSNENLDIDPETDVG